MTAWTLTRDRGAWRARRGRRNPGARRAVLALGLGTLLALGCASSEGPKPEAPDPAMQARARYDLGVDYLRKGNAALAIRELMQADRLQPNDPYVKQALGEAYFQRGIVPEAIAELERAHALKPDFHGATLTLAQVYIVTGRYDDAIACARQLVEDPTFGAPWQALRYVGFAEYKRGRIPEARTAFEQALELRPSFWRALLDLGILEAEQGERDRALALFQMVLSQRPGPLADAEVNFRIGEILVARGENQQAVAHLTAAVENKASGEWGRRSEEALKILR